MRAEKGISARDGIGQPPHLPEVVSILKNRRQERLSRARTAFVNSLVTGGARFNAENEGMQEIFCHYMTPGSRRWPPSRLYVYTRVAEDAQTPVDPNVVCVLGVPGVLRTNKNNVIAIFRKPEENGQRTGQIALGIQPYNDPPERVIYESEMPKALAVNIEQFLGEIS